MKSHAAESERPPGARSELESARVERGPKAEAVYVTLLDLATRLDIEAGTAEVCRQTLDALAALLPRHALGLCVVSPEGGDTPWVDLRLPPGMARPGRDPTRLFPELPDEHVVAIPGVSGSTLHVASPEGEIPGGSTAHLSADRAARVLGHALGWSHRLSRVKPPSAAVDDLRRQLVQAEKLSTLGQIVAGVAHELANPVTSIVACTEYLLRRAPGDAETREQLERIGLSAGRILKFSRDLTTYARPASDEALPVALHEVIAQAHGFSQHELEQRGITVVTDYGEGAPPILGQAGPLTQVFINLFVNASHAMSEHGGRLVVKTRVDRERRLLLVDVTDTGVGMAPETVVHIFEPFFTTKEPGKGTGLGLSMVREIIEAHAGRIDVASTPGEGTTFTIALPLLPARS